MFHHACKKGFSRRRLIVVSTPSPYQAAPPLTVVAEDLTPRLSTDYVRYVSSSIGRVVDMFARRERFIHGHRVSIGQSVSGYAADNGKKIVEEHMTAVYKHVFGDLS